MGTFTREFYNNLYYKVSSDIPGLSDVLSFDTLLHISKDELKVFVSDNVQLFTNAFKLLNNKGLYASFERFLTVQSAKLVMINSYGHSLVFEYNGKAALLDDDRRYGVETFFELNKHVHINACFNGERIFCKFSPNIVTISRGVSKYSCYSCAVNCESGLAVIFYIPTESACRRVFMHTTVFCECCKHRSCLYDKPYDVQFVGGSTLAETAKHVFDCHYCKSVCIDLIDACIKMLSRAARFYMHKTVRKNYSINSFNVKSDNTVDSKQHSSSNQQNERFVTLVHNRNIESYLSGTHASPKAHTVRGFYRRRSKTDPTLIYINPYTRGGTKEEREKLDKNIVKTTVFVI